jgi:hypothetical protein
VSRPRRFGLALLGVVVIGGVAGAGPAAAHTIGGVQATSYKSDLVSLDPPSATVELRLLDLGRRVQLTNRGRADVVVFGYGGEPYLRVGPGGVFENRRSPTLYKNMTTVNGTAAAVPKSASASAAPQWRRTGGGRTVRWRDQRTRWEGADAPAVKRDPSRRHVVVQAWTIQLRAGTQAVAATGRIVYVPPPALAPWVLIAVALLLLTAALGLGSHWGPQLSGAVALLVAVDVVQTFASGAVTHDGLPILFVKVVLGGIFSSVAWVVGALSISPLQRGREGALIGAGVAGLFIALFSGLTDLGTLVNSQAPSTLPDGLARAGVSVAFGVGLGLVAAVFVVIRTHPDVRLAPPEAPARESSS